MRIGIRPDLDGGGGIYQYSLAMLSALRALRPSRDDQYIVFAPKGLEPVVRSAVGPDWPIVPPVPPVLRRGLRETVVGLPGIGAAASAWKTLKTLSGKPPHHNPDAIRRKPRQGDWFRHWGIDLVVYPSPDPLSFEAGVPYIMAIHDLQHRLQPEFSEVSADGEWERREYLYRNGVRHALVLVADSEVGKQDILNFYGQHGATADRTIVLPFLPPTYLSTRDLATERQRVQSTYRLPDRYLFYPAHFWPHKNHARIVRALEALRQRYGLRIPIVFCGAYPDDTRRQTFDEMMRCVRHFGLDSTVSCLGRVPDSDMSGLYAGATALVMPTFFGPTNIPVLEAWLFGCPVLTSDIRGTREQAGDAAILVDPRSVEAIADGIHRLWTNPQLCGVLAERGRQRLETYTRNDYCHRLMEILEKGKARVRSEKPGNGMS